MKAPSAFTLMVRYALELWQNAVSVSKLRTQADFSLDMPRLLEGTEYISIGASTCIRRGCWFAAFPSEEHCPPARSLIRICNHVYIGFYATITAVNLVEVHTGTVISDHFYASDHAHGCHPEKGSPADQPVASKGPVIIGKNCLIGMRVSILPGVTLGDHCVVGAHSVVTGSFPERSVIAGVPAKLLKTFDSALNKWVPARE